MSTENFLRPMLPVCSRCIFIGHLKPPPFKIEKEKLEGNCVPFQFLLIIRLRQNTLSRFQRGCRDDLPSLKLWHDTDGEANFGATCLAVACKRRQVSLRVAAAARLELAESLAAGSFIFNQSRGVGCNTCVLACEDWAGLSGSGGRRFLGVATSAVVRTASSEDLPRSENYL